MYSGFVASSIHATDPRSTTSLLLRSILSHHFNICATAHVPCVIDTVKTRVRGFILMVLAQQRLWDAVWAVGGRVRYRGLDRPHDIQVAGSFSKPEFAIKPCRSGPYVPCVGSRLFSCAPFPDDKANMELEDSDCGVQRSTIAFQGESVQDNTLYFLSLFWRIRLRS